MVRFLFFIAIMYFPITLSAQNYWDDWERKTVNEFYSKIDLPVGTLDASGILVSYVYSPTSLKNGTYKVTISDEEGDFYVLQGTDIYLTFSSYVGYWGYFGKEGVLDVSNYSSYFFISPQSDKKEQKRNVNNGLRLNK